jgi:hypothetical protein
LITVKDDRDTLHVLGRYFTKHEGDLEAFLPTATNSLASTDKGSETERETEELVASTRESKVIVDGGARISQSFVLQTIRLSNTQAAHCQRNRSVGSWSNGAN